MSNGDRKHLTQPKPAPAASGFLGKFQHPTRCGHSTITWRVVGVAANTRAHTKRPSLCGSTPRDTVRFNPRAYCQWPACIHQSAVCLGSLAGPLRATYIYIYYLSINRRSSLLPATFCMPTLPNQHPSNTVSIRGIQTMPVVARSSHTLGCLRLRCILPTTTQLPKDSPVYSICMQGEARAKLLKQHSH
jgi:hypothetical protein